MLALTIKDHLVYTKTLQINTKETIEFGSFSSTNFTQNCCQ